ncbi:MAG: hypothetical protein AB8E82_10795 [Aureispira sp.]
MKTFLSWYLGCLLVLHMSACRESKYFAQKGLFDKSLYEAAIQDAMYVNESKVYKELVAINKSNEQLIWKQIDGEDYLLVVTWKQNMIHYSAHVDSLFYNTANYPIWVTTAPELLERIKSEQVTDVNRRLRQLLGLPPNAAYFYFIEFWVRPQDLFRPCLDKEISDSKCELCVPAKKNDPHISWMDKNRVERYYNCALYQQYPWTQLGYTYDWNPKNKTHVGLSEFVIGKNKNIVVKGIYTTEMYLKNTQ